MVNARPDARRPSRPPSRRDGDPEPTEPIVSRSSSRVVAARALVASALSLGVTACSGVVGDSSSSPFGPFTPGPRPSPSPTTAPGADAGVTPSRDGGVAPSPDGGVVPTPDSGVEVPLPDELPAPMPRVVRLTHDQWGRAVRDLLQLPDVPTQAAQLRADSRVAGFIFENDAPSMEVDEALWEGYRRAASEIVAGVVGDAARLARIAPPGNGGDEARATEMITRLGRLAHRRTLTDAERDRYLALYRDGVRLGASATFAEGARQVLEALIQAPAFVYRVESSARVVDGAIVLDGPELATRLALTLWKTIPDAALLDRAERGELDTPEAVRATAVAMLADPRASDVAAAYHALLLDARKLAQISPLPDVFTPRGNLATAAAREQDLFVRWVFDEGGSLATLLTSDVSFVNDDLARLYGLSGTFGPEHVRATLDARTRKGVFGHVGFLAANATTRDPDPIHRGVFLTERIVCNPLGAPPANIPPLPPPMGRTNRETVEDHTEQPGSSCAGCHRTLINPFGFPFERFDVVGRLRDLDNGNPIDTRADAFIGGEMVTVNDANALVDALAASEAVHRCYAKHWVEFALGRKADTADAPLVERLTRASVRGTPVKELLLALVSSPSFRTRPIDAP
jgi:hypothetical protein